MSTGRLMGSGLATAVVVEWRKTVTTRMWWVLLVVLVAYVAGVAAFLAATFAAAPPAGGQVVPDLSEPDVLTALYTIGLPVGYVFPLVLGVLTVTTELRYRTLTSTLLADPRRPRVLVAKLVVALAFGALLGVAATVAGTAGVAPVAALQGAPLRLDESGVLAALARSAAAMTLWAAVGVGVGALLRNQVAAVVAALAFSQLVEPVARLGLSAVESLSGVAAYLPGAAGDAMAGASLFTLGGQGELLQWWQGALVLGGYAAALLLAGAAVLLRRDVA